MITTIRMTAKKKNVLSKEDKVLNIFIPNRLYYDTLITVFIANDNRILDLSAV